VQSIGQVTGTISEIAAASAEQSRGIDTVSASMTDMSSITQRNVASAEESSAAAEALATQAEHLASLVGSFTLHGKRALVAAAQD
jgi:methyl-accepting chemotaxis protein